MSVFCHTLTFYGFTPIVSSLSRALGHYHQYYQNLLFPFYPPLLLASNTQPIIMPKN
jgi:hypothetical protein